MISQLLAHAITRNAPFLTARTACKQTNLQQALTSLACSIMSPRSCSYRRGGIATQFKHAPGHAGPGTQRNPHPRNVAASSSNSFEEKYREAFTMSQLYVQERPPAIPLSEHQKRTRARDLKDIAQAAKKRGLSEATISENVGKLESLLPDVVNLNRLKASDWVTLLLDVSAVANKLIILKDLYPNTDIFQVVAKRPRMLLQTVDSLTENAGKVNALLARAPDRSAILLAVPEFTEAFALSQALATLKSWYPDKDPVMLLQQNPLYLQRQGQSDADIMEEYGELSTKD